MGRRPVIFPLGLTLALAHDRFCLADQRHASHSKAATEMQSPRNFLPITQEFSR